MCTLHLANNAPAAGQAASHGVYLPLNLECVTFCNSYIAYFQSRASVLQNPVGQNQSKQICEPVIKKSLVDHTLKTSRFRRRLRTQLHPQPDSSGELHQSKEPKISGFDNKCENSVDKPLVECNKGPSSRDQSPDIENQASKLSGPVKESITDGYTNTSSVGKRKFPQHPRSTKRVQRRRSAAVLGLRTPLRRRSANLEVKSTSKLKGSTFLSKIPKPKGSENCAELKKSLMFTSTLSCPQLSDKLVLPDGMDQEEDNIAQKDVSLKVGASTSIFNVVSDKLEDMKILQDIEDLLKEQEKLNIKASLLQEKIEARRLDIKEKKLVCIKIFDTILSYFFTFLV